MCSTAGRTGLDTILPATLESSLVLQRFMPRALKACDDRQIIYKYRLSLLLRDIQSLLRIVQCLPLTTSNYAVLPSPDAFVPLGFCTQHLWMFFRYRSTPPSRSVRSSNRSTPTEGQSRTSSSSNRRSHRSRTSFSVARSRPSR